MPTYAVLFTENPDADPTIRSRVFPDHLAFLSAHSDQVRDAGTLFFGDGSRYGGMWIVTADTAADVTALVHADPFWPTGLRAGFEVLEWRKVLGNGAPLSD
ncbi:MAG: YciI family protein [Pseudomonadota bacterium]